METQLQTSPAPGAPAARPAAAPWPQPAATSAERVREMLGWRLIPANAGGRDRDER